jgi:hypothetical protein
LERWAARGTTATKASSRKGKPNRRTAIGMKGSLPRACSNTGVDPAENQPRIFTDFNGSRSSILLLYP